MYRRKASLDQRPIIMMVKVGTLDRYMAIAALDLSDRVPMSSGLKSRCTSPIDLVVDRSLVSIVEADSLNCFSSTWMVLAVVDPSVLG